MGNYSSQYSPTKNSNNSYELLMFIVQYSFKDAHPKIWRETLLFPYNCRPTKMICPIDTPHIHFSWRWNKSCVYAPTSTPWLSTWSLCHNAFPVIHRIGNASCKIFPAVSTEAVLDKIPEHRGRSPLFPGPCSNTTEKHNVITRWKLWCKHWALI
jgi:hypothetical protein